MKLSPKAQASLDKMVARFQAGDISPITAVAVMDVAEDAPMRRWTFSNAVMAYSQTGSLDNRGFRQWEEVGRSVKKGERGGFILFPKMVKDKDDPNRSICIGFGTVAVFGLDQTEGEDIPNYKPRRLPPLQDVARKMGLEVSYGPLMGARGSYSLNRDKIRLATDSEKTFFHELAHAAHHTFTDLKAGQDAGQETVAELAAVVLMDMYGLKDMSGNTWEYIKAYNPDDPIRAISNAVGDVQKVLDVILSLAEEPAGEMEPVPA